MVWSVFKELLWSARVLSLYGGKESFIARTLFKIERIAILFLLRLLDRSAVA